VTAPVRDPKGLPRRLPPKRPAVQTAPEMPALDLARRIVELAEDKKAADIVLLDLSGLTTMADYFVIASGGSERQLDAIADGVISGMRDEKVHAFGREGTAASHWVLVDFASVVLHVFTPPERDYYQLEKAWAEAKVILRVQ
jgi:ribosome-associated protein